LGYNGPANGNDLQVSTFEFVLEIAATTKHRWAMPLRNFGLTSFRVSARPDVGVTRSPAHGVGVTFLILMLIVLALMLG
jgi:hypothetical protein